MPVFTYALKRNPGPGRLRWFITETPDEQAAHVMARASANKHNMRLYAGPLVQHCRWCEQPAIELIGAPTPWAPVCAEHKAAPRWHVY